MSDDPITSFLSFDVEALYGRTDEAFVERLVWGEYSGGYYGIPRICSVLRQHKLKASFMIDFAMCMLYGEKTVKRIVEFLRSEGHEIHAHLHSEWIDRTWNINLDAGNPVAMSRLDRVMSEAMMRYTAFQFHALTGVEPSVFRAGGYLFNAESINAIRNSGFKAASNYNSERHANTWQLAGGGQHNEPFYWPNQLLEIPVDFSPEPLSSDWSKYQNWFERAARKSRGNKTFNLVMHSWSLLKREGEFFTSFASEHEERLHRICEHLRAHTQPSSYDEFLARPTDVAAPYPTLTSLGCTTENFVTPPLYASCNICGHPFLKQPESDLCPGCKSRPRQRQLADVCARSGNPFDGMVVLSNYADRTESGAFLRKASSVLNFDVRPVSEVELQLDLQDMPTVRADTCDRFLALHVLNHVQDDEKALAEIHRVLKPGGLAIITIPHWGDKTELATDLTESYGEDALERYGVGTFRRYGLADARALFAKYFEVSIERGTDPLHGASLEIFFLRKAGPELAMLAQQPAVRGSSLARPKRPMSARRRRQHVFSALKAAALLPLSALWGRALAGATSAAHGALLMAAVLLNLGVLALEVSSPELRRRLRLVRAALAVVLLLINLACWLTS